MSPRLAFASFVAVLVLVGVSAVLLGRAAEPTTPVELGWGLPVLLDPHTLQVTVGPSPDFAGRCLEFERLEATLAGEELSLTAHGRKRDRCWIHTACALDMIGRSSEFPEGIATVELESPVDLRGVKLAVPAGCEGPEVVTLQLDR
ncbi:MAG: hypothetical protein HKN26_08935 [Acidimicrobiales bacterium]|nr:hypothetical protein [Acidimicrobiales bacterium]